MNYKIPPLASDIIITIYVVVSLFFRFKYETDPNVSPIVSIILGASFILILWVLIKLEVLNPNWFGLLKTNKNKS